MKETDTTDEDGKYDEHNLREVKAIQKEIIGGMLQKKDERSAKAGRDRLHLVSDRITITIDKMSQAVDTSAERNLAAFST